MSVFPAPPCRLSLDAGALRDNWRALDRLSETAACGAAVKADGYGLGAAGVATRLAAAGCRDFLVATWGEAAALAPLGLSVSVLHGVRAADLPHALASPARPVLASASQVSRWREAGGGVCDVMVDTGMNRLGVSVREVADGVLDGLAIDTLMSHLACADGTGADAAAANEAQRARFAGLAGRTDARRMSLANSAGIALGAGYAFDLTRPGLALYGGVPCPALAGVVRPVARIEAEVLQRRLVPAGDAVGYDATWRAPHDTAVAILNLGYADGYARALSNRGLAFAPGGEQLPVIGRVSMDLVALDVTAAPGLGEGDWIAFDDDLARTAAASAMSPYELLTRLGPRLERVWRD